MKRKRFMLVSVGMDGGNEFVGVVWTKEVYGKPQEYIIRLFESRFEAQRWAEKAHPDKPIALFSMQCINPIDPNPPAPAEPPAEPEQASEEESEQSNVEP